MAQQNDEGKVSNTGHSVLPELWGKIKGKLRSLYIIILCEKQGKEKNVQGIAISFLVFLDELVETEQT